MLKEFETFLFERRISLTSKLVSSSKPPPVIRGCSLHRVTQRFHTWHEKQQRTRPQLHNSLHWVTALVTFWADRNRPARQMMNLFSIADNYIGTSSPRTAEIQVFLRSRYWPMIKNFLKQICESRCQKREHPKRKNKKNDGQLLPASEVFRFCFVSKTLSGGKVKLEKCCWSSFVKRQPQVAKYL